MDINESTSKSDNEVSISHIDAIVDQENFKKEFKDEIYNPKLKLCGFKLKNVILFYTIFHFAWIILEIFAVI